MDDNTEVINVNPKTHVHIVVGHDAKVRETPTDCGLTHDWTVFVRGKHEKYV